MTKPQLPPTVRLVIVGDKGAGKTTLCWRLARAAGMGGLASNPPPPEPLPKSLPREFGPCRLNTEIKGVGFVDLDLSWDIAGERLWGLGRYAESRGYSSRHHNRDAEALLL